MRKSGLRTFRGGVHPEDGKALSAARALTPWNREKLLFYSLSQHIGAPARPTVAKGDHVLRGQKIAEAGGFVSGPGSCQRIRYGKGDQKDAHARRQYSRLYCGGK